MNNASVHQDSTALNIDEKLAGILLNKKIVSKEKIDAAIELIKQGDTRQLGTILIANKHLNRKVLIRIVAQFINLPNAKKMLLSIEKKNREKSKNTISGGVESNVSPFVMDDDSVKDDLFFMDGNVKVLGPALDVEEFKDCQMDELQVSQMAIILLEEKKWEEAEEYLVEAIQDFPKSTILRYELIWLYSATGYQNKAIEHSRMIEESQIHNNRVYELLGWTMFKNSKFLEAVRFYQILCREKDSESIWFYLLAVCLYKSNLLSQSKKVFKHALSHQALPQDLEKNAQFYLSQLSEH